MTPEPLYLIYSAAHKGWWRPNSMGYCVHHSDAGRYTKAEADDICLHGDSETCFPETHPRFVTDTPRADALIANLAYQFPGTEDHPPLEEIRKLERELNAYVKALKIHV